MTRDFRERDLIVSDDVDEYDGTTAVVRSEHLDALPRSSSCGGAPSGG